MLPLAFKNFSKLIGFAALGFILSKVLSLLLLNGCQDKRLVLILSQIASQLLTFAIPAILLFRYNGRMFFKLGLDKIKVSKIILSLVILIFSSILIAFLASLSIEYFNQINFPETVKAFLDKSNIVRVEIIKILFGERNLFNALTAIFVVAVLPAFCEELFFRGALQNIMLHLFINKNIAIILTAFIFTLAHLDFYNILPMFTLSLIIGYIYYYTKSLWSVILVHFLNNLSAIISYFVFEESINPLEQSTYGFETWYFALFAAYLIYLCFKKLKNLRH